MSEILGLAGTLLIVLGWIFEVKQIIRRHHSPLDWNFGMLYLSGSILLGAYAIVINAWIFAFLNALAALMALFSLYYKWREKKSKKPEIKSQEEHMRLQFTKSKKPLYLLVRNRKRIEKKKTKRRGK